MVKKWDGVMGGSRFDSQCGPKRKKKKEKAKTFTYKKVICGKEWFECGPFFDSLLDNEEEWSLILNCWKWAFFSEDSEAIDG